MDIANRRAPWKIANGTENPVLQALQFQQMGFCRKFPVIADLITALWGVNLILMLNRSLLNRGYIFMNVLKDLTSIVSVCIVHVISLSQITHNTHSSTSTWAIFTA
jgi:hypothetical protein